ncbi:MAG: fructose-bisphosphate aldolase [Gammaproteobacteria bacterium]|nr:fructose-bisphosphate aldolase [Gammaproteobacteria bacterium]
MAVTILNATATLNTLNQQATTSHRQLAISYGRALQKPGLHAWKMIGGQTFSTAMMMHCLQVGAGVKAERLRQQAWVIISWGASGF